MPEAEYRHEDVAAVPAGYRVVTIPSGEHLIRLAFPPGRRRKGSGRLVSILHPPGENPEQATGRGKWHGYIVLEDEIKYTKSTPTRAEAFAEAARAIDAHPDWAPVKSYGAVKLQNPCRLANPRVNPDELERAEKLYRRFHGKSPSEILELQSAAVERKDYTALGDLVELRVLTPSGDTVKVKFKSDGVKVASSPEGTQLYLIGGNQDISGALATFGADNSKDIVDLGEAKQIVYEAGKWQANFEEQEWKHDFGEESGIRPRAFFNQLQKRIFFAGGNYRVERSGIVD